MLTLGLPTQALPFAVTFLTLHEPSKKKITDTLKLLIFHIFEDQPAPCQHTLKCTCFIPFTTGREHNHLNRHLDEKVDVEEMDLQETSSETH